MALTSCRPPVVIGDSSLEGWKVIDSGGFGQIYKARHQQWCCDVAIKLLHHDDGEVDLMRQGSSPYVIQVLGVFKGRAPCSGSAQLGLVMEFMERGSLAFLQNTMGGPPPWPLVFRLSHQVALGINFLHSLSPVLLHLDLKPNNVLLDSSLNAKYLSRPEEGDTSSHGESFEPDHVLVESCSEEALTDFGLARVYHSVSQRSKKDEEEEEGGTLSYMPPEAFDLSYTPTKASDIYSYGILLWSIVTGRQPYANAMSSIVRFRIPQGDRPSLEEIRSQAAGRAGLTGLMELMQRCWEAKPAQRPSSFECTTVTEELYKMHKHAILDAVHHVLKTLNQKEEQSSRERVQRVQTTQASVRAGLGVTNIWDVLTGGPPVQEVAGGWAANQRDKTRVEDSSSPRPASNFHADQSRSSPDYKVKASSVHPIYSSPPSPSTKKLPHQSRTAKNSQVPYRESLFPQYQRQFSSPDSFPCHPPPARGVYIHCGNVTGFQHGNNNTMHIYAADPSERKRHPTAPSTINLPPPR